MGSTAITGYAWDLAGFAAGAAIDRFLALGLDTARCSELLADKFLQPMRRKGRRVTLLGMGGIAADEPTLEDF